MRALVLTKLMMAGCLMLTGCAGLTVSSSMSSSIFLDPLAPEKRIVYVQVRSTADRRGIDIKRAISAGIAEAGYNLTDNPDRANILLQANVLKVGESDPDELRNFLSEGPRSIGGTAAGIFTGLAVADAIDSDLGGAAAGVAAGLAAAALVEGITNLLYDEKLYAVVTDVQLAERVTGGVQSVSTANISQGDQSFEQQRSIKQSQWKKYRTRIVSYARAVNTPWQEVADELSSSLSTSIAGMF